MSSIYILADRNSDGSFTGTELTNDINSLLENLEYGDVAADAYQIWEYPSGKIYHVTADVFTALRSDDYSLQSPDKWLPILNEQETNSQKVTLAYDMLSFNNKRSLKSKIKKYFKSKDQ